MDQKLFDQAIDFAEQHRNIEFCRKMLLVFRVKGNLTEKQVLALLRIKAGYLRAAQGRRYR